MSRWQPWTNTTKDAREKAADAGPQGNKGHAASGSMKAVVDAATGTGAPWPASQPLVDHDSTKKEQA